jgi:hypothetical protein
MSKSRRGHESGFAMLMVFVVAAVIAISLYFELPRAMFEHTRQKEQLLIDHGEQYTIAIRRFYIKFGRWPTTMDELANTNNMRFLRRQFNDPMTGKADWRIIHESAGILTDSLVHPANPLAPGQNGAPGSTGSTGSTGGQSFGSLISSQPFGSSMTSGSTGSTADQPAPRAWGLLFRPSDRGPLGTAHGGVAASTGDTQSPDDASGAGTVPGYPDTGANSNAATNPPATGAAGALGSAGATGSTGPNAVTTMIQNGLTNPQQSPNTSPFGQNPSIAGGGIGIAGVASTSPYEGIKRYKDHSKYKEWEFVFDASSMQQLQAPQQAPGQLQPGQNGNSNSPFGGGNTSPFGSNTNSPGTTTNPIGGTSGGTSGPTGGNTTPPSGNGP